MLVTGNTKVGNLFAKTKQTDRFITELLNDGSVCIAKVDPVAHRARVIYAASDYVSRMEKQLAANGYEVYFAKLSIGQTACLILGNNKLIYTGYSKCNMEKDEPSTAIGGALSIWRALYCTPFECKLPAIIWSYVFK